MPGRITETLNRWQDGDERALAELVPLVYGELRQLADAILRGERPGHTLQPTALVHEVYLRFTGLRESAFKDRGHFYGAAARAMRRILVDHARRRDAVKRGDGWTRVSLDDVPITGFDPSLDFVELDDALSKLAAVNGSAARVIELRCFTGLSVEEAARCLDVAPVTVKRHWRFGRAWLARALGGPPAPAAELS
jgi:RNA polymerase sigma factor (TIGR02999 family)